MKQIGLVLSGGLGKGAYQIGALQALSHYFEPCDFQYVSAASIGAINTYAYLTDHLKQAARIWNDMDLKGHRHLLTSILKSDFIQKQVHEITSSHTITPSFYVPLLELPGKELHYCNLSRLSPDEVEQHLNACVTLPFYCKGISIGSKLFYDGGVVDNIPVQPILQKDLDYVICMYFDDRNYLFENETSDQKIIKLTFPDNHIIANSFNLSHEAIVYMMKTGYSRTYKTLSRIFSDGIDNTDSIYQKIAEHNQLLSGEKTPRLTCDVVISNLNRVTRKMMRHTDTI
ncbi:MAG: patatin-like phospholipase family protein [Clostridia bacterium]|nr:patatin-like phospholipase family protein [Clostridia bacterium]